MTEKKWKFYFTLLPPFLSIGSCAGVQCSITEQSANRQSKKITKQIFLSKGQEVETTQGIDIEFNCIFILSTFR